MVFNTFPINATNIFPAANGTTGSQLLTEYNLRARETVDTAADIKYIVGHSFVHSADDFKIQSNAGNGGSSSELKILPGRGIINGHYVETLVPMIINLAESNARSSTKLSGALEVGIKVTYSSEATMAGSLLASEYILENGERTYMYEGLQILILPKGDLKTPLDSPDDPNGVTAHLRLGTFRFDNGAISSIHNDDNKTKYLDANRIQNISDMLGQTFLSKSNLDRDKLYVFAGKGTDNEGRDTWCDANDSLMVWDDNPTFGSQQPPANKAGFVHSGDQVSLYVPHKQIDGTENGNGPKYLQPVMLNLPIADYEAGTPGTVSKAYTQKVKSVVNKINEFYQIHSGKQVGFIGSLADKKELPELNPAWDIGDYILVAQDLTVFDGGTDSAEIYSAPSTMYVVLPGLVTKVQYVGKSTQVGSGNENKESSLSTLVGIKLDEKVEEILIDLTDDADDNNEYNENYLPETDNTNKSDEINSLWGLYADESGNWTSDWSGVAGSDFFVYKHIVTTKQEGQPKSTTTYRYYYKVAETKPNKVYSDPIFLSKEIPLAQESMIGGFLNSADDLLDQGYVYIDDNGHLRLRDYALLRSGTLAYQLAEDIEVPEGLTTEEIQVNLDDYVNERVAFPNMNVTNPKLPDTDLSELDKQTNALNSTLLSKEINITVTLPEEDEASTLVIRDIDSRFGSYVHIHIKGEANPNTTVYVMNCEKVKIDSNIEGSPTLVIDNCNLYYDAYIIDRAAKITDLSLWYNQITTDDINLIVDNMTVQAVDVPIVAESLDFWNRNVANDNHFMYALRSITLAKDGSVIGCSMYVKNNTTSNVSLGTSIVSAPFELPQGLGLAYPATKVTRQLKITGSFVSAYSAESGSYIVQDTNFTALSQGVNSLGESLAGRISFFTNAMEVDSTIGTQPESIDGWEPNSFHIFYGGVIG